MKRENTICPACGSKARPYKEKYLGVDTLDLICSSCSHVGFWLTFRSITTVMQ